MFAAPTETSATLGATASTNCSVELVAEPWWPSLSTSAPSDAAACSSSHSSSPRSASPVNRNRTAPCRTRTTVLASLGSVSDAVQAESGAKDTFVPGRPSVKPPSPVLMWTKSIWTATPAPMPHGSARSELTVASKVTLSPFCVTFSPVRSNEPGL